MRTLTLNKTKLWCMTPSAPVEEVDEDGFYTGEMVETYSTKRVIYLHLYPSTGVIVEQLFGKDASFDMIAVSNDVGLTSEDLLFLSDPTSQYDTTYDYRVKEIKKSLNTYQYGLVRRT